MKADMKSIISMIRLPEELTRELEELEKKENLEKQEAQIQQLTIPGAWEQARTELRKSLEPDERGRKMLYCMLKAAVISLEKYQKKGIPQQVFTDTMKCFSRFTREHLASFGNYGFDRDFWTGRQLSLLLFRIGELEYEKAENEQGKVISVHIPSDADLTPEKCRQSINDMYPLYWTNQ